MTSGLILLAVVCSLAALHAAFAVLTPLPRRGLRVLMYHRVSEARADRGTIPLPALERQLAWLRRRYQLVSLGQVVAHARDGAPLPDRAVLLTFDDGTEDAHLLLAPLLARLGVPAALFAVPGLAGQARHDHGPERRFCDGAALRRLAAGGVEIGLHSWEHSDLAQLSPAMVQADLGRCAAWLERERIPYAPALAYPFGAYPRKDPEKLAAFLWAVGRAGVAVAFRIGNRVNRLPLRAPLEVQRTEIRGDDSFLAFAWKVRTGRLRGL